MEQDEIKLIASISEDLELRNNDFMRDVLDEHDNVVAMNVLINVATSMMAKALIMVNPDAREHLEFISMKIVKAKVDEGTSMVESHIAIEKAMGKW